MLAAPKALGAGGAGAEAPKAPELVRKRIQQKSTNTAEARDSEQKLPTGSTRLQIYRRGLYKYRRILKVLTRKLPKR